jgi:DNA-binding response OmpR family regulator
MHLALFDIQDQQRNLLMNALSEAGHESSFLLSHELDLEELSEQSFALFILHWESISNEKRAYLHALRKQYGPNIPILLLVDAGAESEILTGLAAGANDFLVKPIRKDALLTRIHVLLERAYPIWQAADKMVFGQYSFDVRKAKLTLNDQTITLTQKEFDLGLLLFKNMGRPLSRAYILESVWATETEVSSRTIDTHISRVRHKLQLQPEYGFRLVPVYGYGYKLEKITN